MSLPGLFSAFNDALLVEAVRTPWIDYRGALAATSPTDLGIWAGRALLRRSGVDAADIDSVLAGNMAQASFDAYMLPRHIGLYCGVPQAVPALGVQRVCGTGLELLRQGAEQLQRGQAHQVLCVASESMSRNPIASYSHRSGFALGLPVEFKDFLWEALFDPAVGLSMMQTAENLARHHGLRRDEVDAYALRSFQRASQAQAEGWFAGEIQEVLEQTFEQRPPTSCGFPAARRARPGTAISARPPARPWRTWPHSTPAACRPPATAAQWLTVPRLRC